MGLLYCSYVMTFTMLLQVWCARQLARIPGVIGVTDVMGAWYVKLVSACGVQLNHPCL
jgi:hypothetical protein